MAGKGGWLTSDVCEAHQLLCSSASLLCSTRSAPSNAGRFVAGCVSPGHTWRVCQDSAAEVTFHAVLLIAVASTDFVRKIISCALPFSE